MSRTSTCKNKVEFRFYSFVKRLLDIIVAFLGIVILFPIFLIISIAIKIDSKGPVIFKQKRYGINWAATAYKYFNWSDEYYRS